MKDHSIFKKRIATSIMCMLLMAASLLVLPFDMSNDEVKGATSIGTISVTGGNTRTYTGVNYQLDGNIEVSGTNSKLTFINSTIKLSQDVGNDGKIGGGDDHIYHIEVKNGGSLIFENSVLTTQTDQLHPYFRINITVSDSGSLIRFEDSLVEGPGSLLLSDSSGLEMIRSSFIELRDKSDLTYDIDGDGSYTDDLDYNDDGLSLEMLSGSKGVILDSELRDTFSFIVSSRDGLTAGNITLDGQDTNLTVINSFLDIDLESNLSTGSHNVLKISNGAVAHLVGVSINLTSSPSSPAILIEDNSSMAKYYRWIAARVIDGMDVQIEQSEVTLKRVEGSTERVLDNTYLTTEILDYMGRTQSTWNKTDSEGWLFLPAITDVFTYSSMPNSDVTPDFKVLVEAGTETITRKTSFSSYPKLPSQDDQKDLFITMMEGDSTNELIISDLNGAVSFSEYIVDPSTSAFFKDLDMDLNVESLMTINGTGSLVDGKFYPSYYSFDGHLKVGSGGHLIINDTIVDFLTEEGSAYILVEDGGKIEMNNVSIRSRGNNDLYVYVMGSSNPSFELMEGSVDIGYFVGRDTASFHIDASSIDASLNLYGSSVSAFLRSPSINLWSVYSVSNSLNLSGGDVSIGELEWSDVTLGSIDAVFDITLDIDGFAELTNVSYSGNESKWLTVSGNGIIERYFWARAQVVDSVKNPLPGSSISIDRYNGGIVIPVEDVSTDEDGEAVFSLLQERIESGGKTFLGNYRLSATFRGYGSSTYSTSLTGSDIDVRIMIPGGPNIIPGTIMVNGTLISGNHVLIRANVTNAGEFDSDGFNVIMKMNGQEIGSTDVDGLASGEMSWVEFPWICEEGEVEFNLVIDPENELNETVESDNEFSQINFIGLGPDFELTIVDPGIDWVFGEKKSFEIIIRNIGEDDPSGSPIFVNARWSNQFDSDIIINGFETGYIPPGESVRLQFNWTPQEAGPLSLVVDLESKFDRTPSNSIAQVNVVVKTRPDLSIKSGSFIVGSTIPVTINTTTTLEIEIENIGEIAADVFHVAIYDLTMNLEEPIVQPIPVDGLGPGEVTTITFPWFAGSPVGNHEIRFMIDVYDEVREQDETNNNISMMVKVDTPPDIAISDNRGVSPSIVTEGKNTTIWAEIENRGNTLGTDVLVHFSIDSDTNIIKAFIIDLYPGQKINLTYFWDADGIGERRIFIVVDPYDRLIEERGGENNNDAHIDFLVLSRPDLTMVDNDLRVLPEGKIYIDEVATLYATIRNTGQTDARNAFIRFYDGDPDTGGKLIPFSDTQPSVVLDTISAKDTVQIEVPWTPRIGGWHDIHVILDLSDLIDEDDETNNRRSWDIYVQTLPDLVVSNISMFQNGIKIDSAGVGKEVVFNVTVSNEGDTPAPSFKISFHNGNYVKDPLSEKIGPDMTFPGNYIQGGGRTYMEYKWEATYPKGIRTIYASVDVLDEREQTDENNHLGMQIEIFDIEDVPELTLDENSLLMTSIYNGMSPSDTGIGYTGTNISVMVNLTNMGGKVAPNTTVEFRVTNSTETRVEYSTYVEFVMDNSTDLVIGYWMLESVGINTLSIVVDPENRIREFDEGNNILQTTIEVQDAPDLSINLIEGNSQGWIEEKGKFEMTTGKEYILVYEVTNHGNFTYRNVDVNFNGPATVETKTVTISPYDTQRVTFTIVPTRLYDTDVAWKCSVNDRKSVFESDDSNNELQSFFEIKEEEESTDYLMLIIVIVLILIIIILAIGFYVYKRLQHAEMAKCSNCGGMVALDADICPHCGVEFSEELECECGEVIPKGANECPSCGKPVGTGEDMDISDEQEEDAEQDVSGEEEEIEELEEESSETEDVLEDMEKDIDEVADSKITSVGGEADEEEVAECFECGALIPVSAPICPHCGAVFE